MSWLSRRSERVAGLAVEQKALTVLSASPSQDADGWFYPSSITSSWNADREAIESSFESYVQNCYKANGIVFACLEARRRPFSEARFVYQNLAAGRPGKLFGSLNLKLLEEPWPNGTTGELLSRMEQDASLAGNFYATVVGEGTERRLRRLRPDWVTILSGVRGSPDRSPFEINAEVLGYFYHPGGKTEDPVFLTTDRVVHWSPIPDPEAQWRGMSWLTPIVREISADSQATRHKQRFFENGALLNVVVRYDKELSPEMMERYAALFDEAHRGAANAYRTLHLGGGADATVVGTDLKQVDFTSVQGGGETRIAAASGAGAIIAQLSEGLRGSSLNAGNYTAAKRQFADNLLRPNWRTAAGALQKFAPPPGNSPARLWYDVRDVELLKEDRKEAAEIRQIDAATMASLIREGFTWDSVVAYMESEGDRTLLDHSGALSVQLWRPGTQEGQP